MVYRTVIFRGMSPGGGLHSGVKYPIIKIDGVSVIVDSEGKYHEEDKLSGWQLMQIYDPVYDVECCDDNSGMRFK